MSEGAVDDGHFAEPDEVEVDATAPDDEAKDAERRYSDLFNSVSDGLFQTDLEGNYTLVNPAFAAMLGYEPEELIDEDLGPGRSTSLRRRKRRSSGRS